VLKLLRFVLVVKFVESKFNSLVGILFCSNITIDKYTNSATKLFAFITTQVVDGNT
jgi:hypothetical protein